MMGAEDNWKLLQKALLKIVERAAKEAVQETGAHEADLKGFFFFFFFYFFYFFPVKTACLRAVHEALASADAFEVSTSWAPLLQCIASNPHSSESDISNAIARQMQKDKACLKKFVATQNRLHDETTSLKKEALKTRVELRMFIERINAATLRIERKTEGKNEEEEEEHQDPEKMSFIEPFLSCVVDFWDVDSKAYLVNKLKRPREDDADLWLSHRMQGTNPKNVKKQLQNALKDVQDMIEKKTTEQQ
jgi:hypothetical protein